MAELLVAHGADVNAANGREKNTPLAFAVMAGRMEVVQVLVESGAAVNVMDAFGHQPLHWVPAKGWLKRSRGHDLVPTLPPGLQPYHMDHAGVVMLLVSNGADGAIEDKERRTLRDLALQNNNSEIARLLEDGPESGE